MIPVDVASLSRILSSPIADMAAICSRNAAVAAAAASLNTAATDLTGMSKRPAAYSLGDTTSSAYPLMAALGSTTLKQREVSYDTSSKEPHLLRARVFVGNVNTNVISRDDIIRLFSSYGSLLGVTVFKGYAFIQYGTSTEADIAVSVLNGYNWNGSILDVKLAIAGLKSHNASNLVTSFSGSKRGADPLPNDAKKVRLEDRSIVIINDRNRQAACCETTDDYNFYEHGMADTLICGGCRFVTSDFKQFREHRKRSCFEDV